MQHSHALRLLPYFMNGGVNLSVKHFKVVLDSMSNSEGFPMEICVEAGATEVGISSVGHLSALVSWQC